MCTVFSSLSSTVTLLYSRRAQHYGRLRLSSTAVRDDATPRCSVRRAHVRRRVIGREAHVRRDDSFADERRNERPRVGAGDGADVAYEEPDGQGGEVDTPVDARVNVLGGGGVDGACQDEIRTCDPL